MISVIIPTRNRSALLGSALSSLLNQTLDAHKWEILIIDNGSTDSTKEIASAFREYFQSIRYIYDPTPGLHVGRHRGLQEAQGSILVYVDDDIEPISSWLLAIEEGFSDSEVALMGGNSLPIFYGLCPQWLYDFWIPKGPNTSNSIPFLSIQNNPTGKREISPYMVWGCNFAIRRDVLLAAGGFHPDGMPQELIRFRGDGETHVSRYVAENNLKCIFDSRASVFHKVTPERMTLNYIRRRGFNQGVSDSYAALRNSWQGNEVKSSDRGFSIVHDARNRLRKIKRYLTDYESKSLPMQQFAAGHKEGYAFHQDAYRNDPEVRLWVHKENYF